MNGQCRRREVSVKSDNLPCAGITLIRFDGCNLSLSAPRESDAKIDYFGMAVTFSKPHAYKAKTTKQQLNFFV